MAINFDEQEVSYLQMMSERVGYARGFVDSVERGDDPSVQANHNPKVTPTYDNQAC